MGYFGGNRLCPGSFGLSPLDRGQRRDWHLTTPSGLQGLLTPFTLPRPRSPGFRLWGSDLRPFKTFPLAHMHNAYALREIAFATLSRLTLLSSPLPHTPWPVFQHGRHDPATPSSSI